MTQEPPSDDPVLPDPGFDLESPAHARDALQTLKQAMRRARFDDAERVGVQSDLRLTQIARLEMLQAALSPLLAQIPKNVDLFDVGLMPGATPRLFIDMIGFVEMARDARTYLLVQDTRYKRVTLAESADVPTLVTAITDYVARRLLERDKALAADSRSGDPTKPESPAAPASSIVQTPTAPLPAPVSPDVKSARKPRRILTWTGLIFGFFIDLLGFITFFTILAFSGWLLWNKLRGQV